VRDGRRVPFPRLGSSEIGEMGTAFEGMREALEGKKYVEDYVQALTHELKSPIAAIQGAAEILQEEKDYEKQKKFLENIRSESARMHRIVERMLELANLESRRGLEAVEMIDFSQLVKNVLARLLDRITAKGIHLENRAEVPLQIEGERFL